MTCYRLAVQDRQTTHWTWKTTAVTSLQAVLQLLRSYRMLPQDDIRVFVASSKEEFSEMLSRQNNHLASGSVTATQFLQESNIAGGEQAQSASDQRVSAQTLQQGADVATWAKDLWERHTAMRTAQAVQSESSAAISSTLHEHLTTTGVPSSLGMSLQEHKRLEIELGPGGDHDTPYLFTLPIALKERLDWLRLQARVQAGELAS